MKTQALQKWAAAQAEELPGAELTHPFGPDWEVWKVRDKVFMLHTAVTGEAIVILKSEPQNAKALRAAHPEITPGYHMNKQHWITLHPEGSITREQVGELVTESYLLVVENLPKRERPVDPASFGR